MIFTQTKGVTLGVALIAFLFLGKSAYLSAAGFSGKLVFSTQEKLCLIDLSNKRTWKKPTIISLPKKTDFAHNPSWSPDGVRIIFEYTQISASSFWDSHLVELEVDTQGIRLLDNFLHNTDQKLKYPKYSPDGTYLAVLKHHKTELVRDKSEKDKVVDQKSFNQIIVINQLTKKQYDIAKGFAGSYPFSWSWDSQKIAYVSTDGIIIVYNMDSLVSQKVAKGCYPIFDPTDAILFVGDDSHLYKIGPPYKEPHMIDGRDWSWDRLVAVSKDNSILVFIGGGSFLTWEYRTIDLLNLSSHERQCITKKYGIIHGADVFQN